MLKRKLFVFFLLLFMSVPSYAVEQDPLKMLKDLSRQVVQELDKNISRIKKDDAFVHDLVNRILVPHFDVRDMAQAVVGRSYWQQATASTQNGFIKEFTYSVIRTYSSALKSYDGESIKFYPLRNSASDKREVSISSDLILKKGPSIQIQYRLKRQGQGWKIYDFSVDGISIVKNYQAQYATVLRLHKLQGLVQQLHEKNLVRQKKSR